jgi:hypothetical protein
VSGWNFGGWPPPPPSAGGSVTFQAVKDALSVADTAVPFNLQALSSVLNVNGVELLANNDRTGLSIGDTDAGLPLTTNRIAIGLNALEAAQPSAGDNLAVGNNALRFVSTGDSNVAIGHDSLSSATTALSNVAVGNNAALALDSGQENVAIGSTALESAETSIGMVAVGFAAGNAAEGSNCVFLGYRAGLLASTGDNSTMVGSDAGAGVTTGARNTLVGESAGPNLTTQDDNVMVGRQAGVGVTSTGNVCIGTAAVPPDVAAASGISINNRIYGGLNGTDYKVRLGGTGTIATQTEALQVINTGADTVPVLGLNTTGANGAKGSMYWGTRDPSGAVSALGGSLYIRVAGATSGIYINKTAGTGTSWSLVTVVP